MIFCQNCGAQLTDNAAFCGRCGAKQETQSKNKKCPNCGAEASTGMMFCDKCGTRYSAQPDIRLPCPNSHTLVLSREEQFYIGDTAVEVYIDDEKQPNMLKKTGNVVKVQLPTGRHLIKLTNPHGFVRTFIARITEFYIDIQRDDIRISVSWNRITGKIDAKADGRPVSYICHK